MIRTTIYLSDDLHTGLKHLAVEKRESMAELLRKAVQSVYEGELKAWQGHAKKAKNA